MTTHKMTKSKEHKTWIRIKMLCYNKNAKSYKSYGGRGIAMCPEWKSSFIKFFEDMGPKPEDCDGIELISLDHDFCKANCRWVGPHNRRPLSEMPGNKKKEGKRTFKESTMVCIRVEKDYHKFLKRLAIERSKETGEIYSVSQLIREIIEKNAPMPLPQ
uniref:Uncharacterized protein n=2 Tax=Candidatus Criblamydia sequanensis TaxID=340071 RepID=A0A090D3F8_9BACT|nr:hypothetical protein CSEC_p0038 [Criblamydia sequanensis CRIB-18]